MIREDPLLPLKPSSASVVIDDVDTPVVTDDVDTPVLWPSWHCPFQNCAECGLVRYEKKAAKRDSMKNNILPETNSALELWRHVWGEKGKHVWGEKGNLGKHRMQLARVVDKIFPELINREQARMRMAHSFLEEDCRKM